MNTYLSFDIECANTFEGICKMCSFGYVIFNEKFEFLEKKDILINPKSAFDWFLFKPTSKTKLAYSKAHYRSFEVFPSYYLGIKDILTRPYQGIFGFSVMEDLKYIYQSCDRYKLEQIKVNAYDIKQILFNKDKFNGRLFTAVEKYAINVEQDLVQHKSCDDSEMSMRIIEGLCNQLSTSIEGLVKLTNVKKLEYQHKVKEMSTQKPNSN